MDVRQTMKNLFYAFGAQIISLMLSILMSLMIPKLLGIREFSYWQLFIFYIGYTGLFHLGFNDGLYLRIGGMSYSQLDKKLIGTEIRIITIGQVIIAISIMLGACLLKDSERRFVIICTAIYLILYNTSGCIGYIFQAVNQIKIYSSSIMIDRIIFILMLTILFIHKEKNYKLFIICYLIARMVALIYCFIKGKELLFFDRSQMREAWKAVWVNILVGSKLLIANIASMLILGCGRQLMDMTWGIEVFGKLSFALSLTNFFLLFISQISMVLFPALRRSGKGELIRFYNGARYVLGIFLPIAFLMYQPIRFLLSQWLPQYMESLRYLALLIPICVFDGKMQLLCNTYFKVLRKEKTLLFVNVIAMLVSLLLCSFGAYIIKNINFVIVAMTLAIAFRSIMSELILAKQMGEKIILDVFMESVLTFTFMAATWFLKPWFAWCIFFIIYFFYLIFNYKKFHLLLMQIEKIRKSMF